MDPNATLEQLRQAVQRYRDWQDNGDVDSALEAVQAGEDMADLFDALDGWMGSGGFLPAAWARA
jgi:hypothetical protein